MTIDALRASASRAGRTRRTEVDPEVHRSKEAGRLRESCQQFESILWAKLWKEMRNTARSFTTSKDRPWKQMEDLSLEMACDELVERSGGAGLWKMLYDSMIERVAAERGRERPDGGEQGAGDAEAPVSFDARA